MKLHPRLNLIDGVTRYDVRCARCKKTATTKSGKGFPSWRSAVKAWNHKANAAEKAAANGSPLALEVIRGGKRHLRFLPHGYDTPLELPVITSGTRDGTGAWTWNGSIEKPTLRPSIKTNHGGSGVISHIWLNDGECQHLGDSTDGLAGKTLPLRPLGWQCDHGDAGMDHDWKDMQETSGEVDGGPGDRWTWRECRVCGARDEENALHELPPPRGSECNQDATGG